MQIDDLVPPSSTPAYPVSQPDPYIADLLQLADGRFVYFFPQINSVIETSQYVFDWCADCKCLQKNSGNASIVCFQVVTKEYYNIFTGYMNYKKT